MARLAIPQEQLARFCRRHHIRKLSLFGSVLKGTDRPGSDIDLLVEFEPGCTPGLFGIVSMEEELSGMLGRTVDHVEPATPACLPRGLVAGCTTP